MTGVEQLSSPSPIVAAFARANQAIATTNEAKESEQIVEIIDDEENDAPNLAKPVTSKGKRKLQQVVTISSRVTVIRWMIEDAVANGEHGVVLRAISNFASEFRGRYKAHCS